MRRRDFVVGCGAGAGLALAGAGMGTRAGSAQSHSPAAAISAGFKLAYAPHFGMFRESAGADPLDQLRFMADQGFTAVEDNDMRRRDQRLQRRIAAEMARLGMRMGVFVAHTIYWREPNLASGDADKRAEFLADIRESLEIARRVEATWMTVVPGHVDPRLHEEYQAANVVETLKQASAILEPHGLVMVLEPLNPRDHPGLFLKRMPQANLICKAVDSPACKILDDLYHQQVTEGDLIANIDACWDEIAYFQVGDNPGRKEPGTGEINYRNVFAHIHARGFDGIVGMEHGNSKPGTAGEHAVVEAYRRADDF